MPFQYLKCINDWGHGDAFGPAIRQWRWTHNKAEVEVVFHSRSPLIWDFIGNKDWFAAGNNTQQIVKNCTSATLGVTERPEWLRSQLQVQGCVLNPVWEMLCLNRQLTQGCVKKKKKGRLGLSLVSLHAAQQDSDYYAPALAPERYRVPALMDPGIRWFQHPGPAQRDAPDTAATSQPQVKDAFGNLWINSPVFVTLLFYLFFFPRCSFKSSLTPRRLVGWALFWWSPWERTVFDPWLQERRDLIDGAEQQCLFPWVTDRGRRGRQTPCVTGKIIMLRLYLFTQKNWRY